MIPPSNVLIVARWLAAALLCRALFYGPIRPHLNRAGFNDG